MKSWPHVLLQGLLCVQVPLSDLLNTGNFDMEKAATAPGWLHSLRSSEPVTSESVEYGITSFVYRFFKFPLLTNLL